MQELNSFIDDLGDQPDWFEKNWAPEYKPQVMKFERKLKWTDFGHANFFFFKKGGTRIKFFKTVETLSLKCNLGNVFS